jgi:hypothetical protein
LQICEVGGSSKRKISQIWLQSKEKITIVFWNAIIWLHPRSYGLNMVNSAFYCLKIWQLTSLFKNKKTHFVEFAMPPPFFFVAKW